jgi:hypothetical protein
MFFQVPELPTPQTDSAYAPPVLLIFEYKLPIEQFPDGALAFEGFPTTQVAALGLVVNLV